MKNQKFKQNEKKDIKMKLGCKRASFIIALLLVTMVVVSGISSCDKSLDIASFEDLIICEKINEDTLEPIVIKDEFEPGIRKIYAVIKYHNIKENKKYSFIWTNTETGEVLITKDYSSDKKNLSEGYIVSILSIKDEGHAASPGKYTVDFIYNEKSVTSAQFEINNPIMAITLSTLTDYLNTDGSPSTEEEIFEFKQTDDIYLSLKVNYLIKDNEIKAKWFFEEDELLLETPYIIKKDLYKESYAPFGLQNDVGILPPGKYKVEIYLNEELVEAKEFEVIETEIKTAKFNEKLKYVNPGLGISFIYPDNWKIVEFESEGDSQVQLVPLSQNMEIGFLFRSLDEVKDYSEESLLEIAEMITKQFIAEKDLKELSSIFDKYPENEEDNLYARYDVLKEYIDKDNTLWFMPFCFIVKDQDLFLFFGVINSSTYKDDGEIIFYKITDSIEFK